MTTLGLFESPLENIPTATSWYLADLGEAKGKQDLFTKQAPQKLKVLRENALIESAVSSNRIEGIEVEHDRIATVVFGKGYFKDRNEEELRGYRTALQKIHEQAANLNFSEDLIRELHRLTRGEIWDAGQYKEENNDIIERYPTGGERIRFRTTFASETPAAMSLYVQQTNAAFQHRDVHPLIVLAASNLDFLCIHPFRDGNGRVSRLLLLLQAYHRGYEVGRYISLERLIEQNKDRYYETLYQSSQGWHEGKNDPWPYINFVLHTFRDAYKEFEDQVGQLDSPKGAKAILVNNAILSQKGEFRIADIERLCPGVGRDWIRRLLQMLGKQGVVRCQGRGPKARWRVVQE